MEALASVDEASDFFFGVVFVDHVSYRVLEDFSSILANLHAQVMANLGDDFSPGVIFVVKEVWILFFNSHNHRGRIRLRIQIASTSKRFSVLELGVLLVPFNVGLTC